MNCINASNEQIQAIYEKHFAADSSNGENSNFLSRLFKNKTSKIEVSYNYDDEDDVGFVTITTSKLRKLVYQVRGNTPCFFEFSGLLNKDIRYDFSHIPEHTPFFEFVKNVGQKARDDFWKGAQI